MSTRPLEELKPIALEYAKCIMEDEKDTDHIEALRTKLGLSKQKDKAVIVGKTKKSLSYVGIWKIETVNEKKVFVRDPEYRNEFRFWADLPQIPAKGEKYRIAFLGESVARGYFYSPYFTPAKYLESVLNHNSEKEYEVIDLARISIHIDELEELCKESVELEPDAIVVFAGNNWRYSLFPHTKEEAAEINSLIEEEDRFDKIKKILEAKYIKKIDQFTKQLKEILDKHNIPAIFVIPEFNLKDWKSIEDDYILLWPNKTTKQWFSLKEELDRTLESKDYEQIEQAADKLISLNPANPYGYEIIAKCKFEQGKLKEAYDYYVRKRDTSIYRRAFQPVCDSLIRNIILEKSKEYKYEVLDLPQVFQDYLQGDIPGYNLFIDYCHLNDKGIQIAMNHLACRILGVSGAEELEPSILKMSEYLPNAKVNADAYFLAAIHCTHMCEQPYEVLYQHCMKALEYSDHVAENMLHFIKLTNTNIPWGFNKEALYFCNMELVTQYPILYQVDDVSVMDVDLVRAMTSALAEKNINVKKEIVDTRLKYFAPYGKKVDLLSTYYRERSYYYSQKSSGYFAFGKKSYISSIHKYSKFYLIADKSKPIRIQTTLRVPFSEDIKQNIVFKVNDNIVETGEVFDAWKDYIIDLPVSLINYDGVNELVIEWPYIDAVEDKMRLANNQRFEGDELIIRNSRLIYGDIFSLYAMEM